MERKFKTVQLKPKRIKVLYNWAAEQGQVIALPQLVTERQGDEKLLVHLKCLFAGPYTEKLEELSERVQKTLIDEESNFWICGVIDAAILVEGSKQVIDEILYYRQKYDHDLPYFDEAISQSLDPWLAKFGVKH